MHRTILVAVICSLPFSGIAYADIASDLTAQQPSSVVLANAGDLPYTDIFTQVYAAESQQVPNMVAAAVLEKREATAEIVVTAINIAPELTNDIITAAIQAAPDLAPIIVNAAIANGANPDEMLALAIAASPEVDPTAVAEATAAGNADNTDGGIDTVPGTNNTVPAPTVLAGTGGGGGNVASPN
ncbi:MAG: hypothetical protein JXR12_18945 [Neptunomonas phycophila]|uniref:hypothetical protein n=1 Tax=Neptunomonas phycophila TaxID=1572645 RepID=UPI003B8D4F42